MENILAHQTVIFLSSLLWGVVLGVVYDVFRVYRVCVKSGTVSIAVQDVLFFSICAATVFLFLMGTVNGQLRVFCIFGIFLGSVIYRLSVGDLAVKIIASIIKFLEAVLIKPIISLLLKVSGFIRRILSKAALKLKKAVCFFQIYLKKHALVLYNQTRSVFLKRTAKSDVKNNQKGRQCSFERRRKKKSKEKRSEKEKKSFD